MSRFFSMMNRRFGPMSRMSAAELRESRRNMLKVTLAASAGLLLSDTLAFASRLRANKRVVVVGGGFAGLACAHELAAAGYDVTVIDARKAVGGRVLTFDDMIAGKQIEGGAELIGSNHPHWLRYAERFGLSMNDVSEDEDLDAPIVLGGRIIRGEDGAKLWEGVEEAGSQMNALAAPVVAERPWETPGAAALDKRTLRSWLEELKVEKDVRAALDANLSGDNGVATGRMSLLAMLGQVKGGGLDRYWSESEVYRCKGGNQQLAHKLANAIGKDRIVNELRVREIDMSKSVAKVTCSDGRTIECDDVVLAVPPAVWSKIKVNPGIPDTMRPQMGSNVKHLTVVKERFWKKAGRSQYTLGDGDINWTWESTDAQAEAGNIGLTAFCAGAGADGWRNRDKAEREKGFISAFENLFPGYKDQYVTSRFMDWPSDPFSMGAYSAFAPGEVTRCGPMLHKGMGKLHFAGEHCSFAWMGYMEGALHSGVSLARRMATRDGLTGPEEIAIPEPTPAEPEEKAPAKDEKAEEKAKQEKSK